ncbi:hypothetical protein BpHYR1_030476, partial [Brachionus plicatilis]
DLHITNPKSKINKNQRNNQIFTCYNMYNLLSCFYELVSMFIIGVFINGIRDLKSVYSPLFAIRKNLLKS